MLIKYSEAHGIALLLSVRSSSKDTSVEFLLPSGFRVKYGVCYSQRSGEVRGPRYGTCVLECRVSGVSISQSAEYGRVEI